MLDKALSEVVVNVFPEDFEFQWREIIDWSERWSSSFLQWDLEVIGTMFWEFVCFRFAEYIGEFVIFWGNLAEVWVCSFYGFLDLGGM